MDTSRRQFLQSMVVLAGAAIAGSLAIPVIGIGSGRGCDRQVLSSTDVLGLGRQQLRLARAYAGLEEASLTAFRAFREDVLAGSFPAEANLQHMDRDELERFTRSLAGETPSAAVAAADPQP